MYQMHHAIGETGRGDQAQGKFGRNFTPQRTIVSNGVVCGALSSGGKRKYRFHRMNLIALENWPPIQAFSILRSSLSVWELTVEHSNVLNIGFIDISFQFLVCMMKMASKFSFEFSQSFRRCAWLLSVYVSRRHIRNLPNVSHQIFTLFSKFTHSRPSSSLELGSNGDESTMTCQQFDLIQPRPRKVILNLFTASRVEIKIGNSHSCHRRCSTEAM